MGEWFCDVQPFDYTIYILINPYLDLIILTSLLNPPPLFALTLFYDDDFKSAKTQKNTMKI